MNMAAKKIVVAVGRIGGDPKRVTLEGQHTVKNALGALGLNKKASEIVMINGEEISQNKIMDYKLKDGDQVVLSRNIDAGL